MDGANPTPPTLTHLAVDTHQGVEVHPSSQPLDPPQHGRTQVAQTGVVGRVGDEVGRVPGAWGVNNEYEVQHLSLRGAVDAADFTESTTPHVAIA